jgi:tripartite-type tricarboxylate transporter receptor subunit TctC
MRHVRKLLAAAAILLGSGMAASADDASCTVRIIVSGPAGGTPDIIARLAADQLSAGLGRPVIIENRPGGRASITSVQAVKAAEPSGCTLLAANASLFSIGPWAYKKAPFDPANDFTPVIVTATSPNVLVVNSQVPARTLAELAALIKANPNKYNYGSGGVGTPMHLYGTLLKGHAGGEATHIPFRGSAASVIGLMANEIQYLFEQIPAIISHVEPGTLRALAVAGPTRSSALPDVPTLTEAGIQGEAVSWFGLVAPRGTPPAVIEKYSELIRAGIKQKEVAEKLKRLGADTVGTTPAETEAFMQRQLKAWEPLVKAADVIIE